MNRKLINAKISLLLVLFHYVCAAAGNNSMDHEKGTIENISSHYQALPVLYHFEKTPMEQISPGISRQYLYGTQSQIVKWYLKQGAEVPLHYHVNEQITWIVSGEVKVFSQGKVFDVKAGDVLIIPPNVPHRFIALSNTVDIDFFTPARQDWINNTANYIAKPHT